MADSIDSDPSIFPLRGVQGPSLLLLQPLDQIQRLLLCRPLCMLRDRFPGEGKEKVWERQVSPVKMKDERF